MNKVYEGELCDIAAHQPAGNDSEPVIRVLNHLGLETPGLNGQYQDWDSAHQDIDAWKRLLGW